MVGIQSPRMLRHWCLQKRGRHVSLLSGFIAVADCHSHSLCAPIRASFDNMILQCYILPLTATKRIFLPLISSLPDFKISFFTHFPISLFPLPERRSDHDSVSSGHGSPHIVNPFVAPLSIYVPPSTFFSLSETFLGSLLPRVTWMLPTLVSLNMPMA